ncbi:acyl-CoA dehydrogenase [Flexivirga meconopsidis]|uniref:acyl-CoA dehydrogenase family protein n=1 Tax=Flexivirga meconopsidis TaxID=2977121 RepID=UPI00223F7CDC|nr:acyl-CoA dehydrogenase [Flexivirga meconopsidis]
MSDPIVTELRDTLDGRWAELRRRARDELSADWMLAPYGLSIAEHRELTTKSLQRIADEGYGRVGFPTAFGGEFDYAASCVLFEMQAFGDLSLLVKVGVQFGLFGGAVARLGTERHHAAYLKDIMAAKLLGSFAMTEVGHGSNVQALETTATYDDSTHELIIDTPTESAVKTYIGNAAKDARMAVVFAQLQTAEGGHGVHAVLVPVRDEAGNPLPGVTIGDNGVKGGLPGVDNGTFAFQQVRVPKDNLLDAFGDIDDDGKYVSSIDNPDRRFFTMLGTLVRGRVCVGGGSGAAAKKALAIAIRYGSTRRQFSAPGAEQENVILDYLAHQRNLLPRLAKAYALSFAQNAVTERLQELQGEGAEPDQEGQRELESRVAGLKAVTTWHALDTIQACREACGGAGYMAENQLVQMHADVDVFATFEGDNTVLLQLAAKGLLTDYKEMWGDLDAMGMVGKIAGQLGDRLVERTAGRAGLQRLIDTATGRDDDTATDSLPWALSMFEQRAEHVLETLGNRLRKATKDNAFELFNAAQDHVLFAARVHIDRCVLEAALEAHEAMTSGAAKDLLGRVLTLYALSSIEQDKAWFIEHGRINATRSRAVTASVNDLCRELRPHALTLVDALGVPDELITAPIAQ